MGFNSGFKGLIKNICKFPPPAAVSTDIPSLIRPTKFVINILYVKYCNSQNFAAYLEKLSARFITTTLIPWCLQESSWHISTEIRLTLTCWTS